MAFTEADRVQIRKYLGFGDLWLQVDPRLENAITNVQAISDGGTRPNPSPSASEVEIKAIVASLQNIDNSIDANMAIQQGATAVDEVALDSARETARLAMRGRVHVHRLARRLDTMPRSDIFSPAPEFDLGYPPAYGGARTGY